MFYRVMRIVFWSAFFSAFLFAAFYLMKNNFLVIAFLLGAFALFVLFLIQKSSKVDQHYTSYFKDTLLGIGGIIFFTTSFGTLYFYHYFDFKWFEYDSAAHFLISLLFVIMVAMFYELLRLGKNVPSALETIFVSSFVVMVFSFVWEAFQRQGDIWWGTKMFFDYNQPISIDVASDLAADFCGNFFGGILIFQNWIAWNKKWLKENSKIST
jgi:hypothetical protein